MILKEEFEKFISNVEGVMGLKHPSASSMHIGYTLLKGAERRVGLGKNLQDFIKTEIIPHPKDCLDVYKKVEAGNIPRDKAVQMLKQISQEYKDYCMSRYNLSDDLFKV